jgi:FtsZ-binding cell division protein ZapB
MKMFVYPFKVAVKFSLICLFAVLSTGLFAQASLSIQGVLTKSDGSAVDDGTNNTLIFRLWDAETGGTLAHEETISNIQTIGGVYSVILGVNGTPLNAAFDKIYWLGVATGPSAPELTPRPRLTHAPYALSLIGKNNIFPSVGTVFVDAITIAGNAGVGGSLTANSASIAGAATANAMVAAPGAPSGFTSGRGFSFSGKDSDGGLFSLDDDQVSLFTNANERLRASSAGVEIVSGDLIADHQVRTPPGFNGGGGFVISGSGSPGNNSTGVYGLDVNNFSSAGAISILTDGAKGLTVDGGAVTFHHRIFNKNIFQTGNGGLGVFWDQNSGEITAKTSARRFKSNIRPLVDDFSNILKVQPRVYTRPASSNPNMEEMGYIAEEMDSVGLKQLVIFNNDGSTLSVKYDMIVLYAVEVLKTQDATIKQLRAELDALKSTNAQLSTENASLKTDNAGLQTKQTEFSAQLNELSKRMRYLETAGMRK